MLSLVLGEFVSYETVSFRNGRRFMLFTVEFLLLRGERQTFMALSPYSGRLWQLHLLSGKISGKTLRFW